VSQIAQSGKDQNTAIDQINHAISQVAFGVEKTMESAKTSASMGAQLSSQSEILTANVEKFRI
jgi:methyl-accepting chemotaxis protein